MNLPEAPAFGESFHTAGGLPLRLSTAARPSAAPTACQALLDAADADLRQGDAEYAYQPPLRDYAIPLVFAWYYKDPVGLIQYNLWAPWGAAFITTGWVRPALRGQGIYRALYAGLTEKLQQEQPEIRRVHGLISANNKRMLGIAERMGRKLTSYRYSQTLPAAAGAAPALA